jgi:hypothetical protein
MRKVLSTLALAGTLMMMPGLTPAAHAGGYGWLSVGSGFRVGGLSLSLVFGQPFGYPGYYYRFPRPIAYRGVHCTSRCFIDRGVYYHDRDCPLVNAYFRGYGADPYDIYSRYAPRYDGYYDSYGSYGGGYYDPYYAPYYDGGVTIYYSNRGYNRYDRHYSNRGYYDRRYDGRYDRHYDGRYDGGHGGRYDGGHGGWHDGGSGHHDGGGHHDRGGHHNRH